MKIRTLITAIALLVMGSANYTNAIFTGRDPVRPEIKSEPPLDTGKKNGQDKVKDLKTQQDGKA